MNLNQTAINLMYTFTLGGLANPGYIQPPQGNLKRYLHLFRDNTGYMDSFIASNVLNPLSSLGMSGKELTNIDYSKKDVSTVFQPHAQGYITNTGIVAFPKAITDWGQITHIGYSAANYDGTDLPFPTSLLWITRLTNDEYVYTGDTLYFKTGAIRINIR